MHTSNLSIREETSNLIYINLKLGLHNISKNYLYQDNRLCNIRIAERYIYFMCKAFVLHA